MQLAFEVYQSTVSHISLNTGLLIETEENNYQGCIKVSINIVL